MKLLLVFIPKPWLLALLGGIVFLFFGEAYAILGYLAVNAVLFYIANGIGLVIHELGHWLGARMVGEYPRRLVIGSGREVWRTRFFGTKLNIYNKLKTGYIITIFSKKRNYKMRRGLYILAGPLANLFAGISMLSVFPLTLDLESEICFTLAFGVVNILLFFGNLYPKTVNINGIPYKSDGLQIKAIWKGETEEVVTDELVLNNFLDAEDLFQDKSYQEALELYQSSLPEIDTDSFTGFVTRVNIAICKGKLGEWDSYFEELKEIEKSLDEEKLKSLKDAVYANLAWLYLYYNQLEEAKYYGEKAYVLNAERNEIRTIWGAVLIENGDYEKGIELLKPMAELRYSDMTTCIAAMYLAWAYSKQGKENLKHKYWSFVAKQEKELDADLRDVYLRIGNEVNNDQLSVTE